MRLIRRGPLNRREIAALWLAGALLVASPAIAHHVNEPTAPITSVAFRLGEYATGTPAQCGDTVDFQNLRVEQFVTVDAKPSEHWTTRIEWRNPRGLGSPYILWPHQNVGPHGSLNIGHANIPLPVPGVYQIKGVWQGDESGNRIEKFCTIIKG
jgi:hypothetical protein